ncbi:MAG: twin-arginine translocase TatA/TatE family subunit [bacterium]
MFNIGLGELLVVFLFALIFWGPGSLPEIGRNLGRFTRKVRDFALDVRASLGPATKEFDELRSTVDEIRNPVATFAREVFSPESGDYRPPKRKQENIKAEAADGAAEEASYSDAASKPARPAREAEPIDDYLGSGDG